MNYIYAHLIGDYILQNDWMALNKKKSSFHCLIHVLVYMIPFLFCNISMLSFVLIALQHYLIDRTNFVIWLMEIKGSKKFASDLGPWSIIVTDNILHILWMAFVINIFN